MNPSFGAARRRPTHRVVIVGGGAGGLELATRLGRTHGRRGRMEVVLVDRARTHMWKPLLHAVAAGSLNIHAQQVDYLYQARSSHFEYCRGPMIGLDRSAREIVIGEVRSDDGALILPVRRLAYDTLVIAVGSTCNDFETPGVSDHAWKLDSPWQAHLFHRKLVNACFGANHRLPHCDEPLSIAIVGAGATGVELAAELRHATHILAGYGLRNLDADRHIRIALVEAGPRILPNLSEKLADSVAAALAKQRIEVRTGVQVTRVTADAIQCAGEAEFAADLVVWSAGIRAPAWLRGIDGLSTDRIDRLVVGEDLRTTRDPRIFALGDCAAAPWPEAQSTLPPRAQVAHQQAQYLARILPANARGGQVKRFRYRDHGSLISLGHAGAVGSLMGFVRGKGFRIQGLVASLMYWSLYRSHRMALHGFWKTALDTLTGWLQRHTYPRVKLH